MAEILEDFNFSKYAMSGFNRPLVLCSSVSNVNNRVVRSKVNYFARKLLLHDHITGSVDCPEASST
jgi:hypothetical protein